jgi:hypothetical protein
MGHKDIITKLLINVNIGSVTMSVIVIDIRQKANLDYQDVFRHTNTSTNIYFNFKVQLQLQLQPSTWATS